MHNMHLSSAIVSFLAVCSHAIPLNSQSRDVPADELSQFDFWVEYAAASYCHDNYVAETGDKLICWADNCPQVEQADTEILYDFSNTTITDASGFVALDSTTKAIVITFRGSYSVRNWITDATFTFTDPKLCDGCLAELGFWSSWVVVRDSIIETLNHTVSEHPDYEVVVVGHSLGAAVATLAAADIRTKGHPSAKLYAYASPRVANPALAKHITAQDGNYRFSHIDDPVPKLPLLTMGYVHVSPEYFISSATNATVHTGDIEVLEGEVNSQGNTGTGPPLLTAFPAHNWYFGKTDGCKGPGLPL